MSYTLLAFQETVKRLERMVAQLKVTDSVKELCAVLKKQEKANFTIKGSIWEEIFRRVADYSHCNDYHLLRSS